MTHSEKEARQELIIKLLQENDKKRLQIMKQGDSYLLKLVEEEDKRLFDEWLKLKAEPIEEFTDAGKTMFPTEEREDRF